ncbi:MULTISPECIES: TIGR04222 domain-containing membrane protein [Frankia]|uniref:TIGR04222 domain-containing membrane protein n=1 Tax=Frankia TaxID=1854 RepID=UPI0009FBFA74|nr:MULTISPECIES: TIGR04222 domain-containing membrane protein [Frankia]
MVIAIGHVALVIVAGGGAGPARRRPGSGGTGRGGRGGRARRIGSRGAGRPPGTVISRRPAVGADQDLRCAIHQEIDAHGERRIAELGRWLAGTPALAATRQRLCEEGLLPTVRQKRVLRWCRTAAWALFVGGIILLVADVGSPDGNAVFVLALGEVGALVLGVCRTTPRTTLAGWAVATEARQRLPGLAGGGLPGQHALAVALFGPEALGRADRKLATELGLLAPAVPLRPRSVDRSRRSLDTTSSGGCGGEGCGGGGCGGGGDGPDRPELIDKRRSAVAEHWPALAATPGLPRRVPASAGAADGTD